LFIDCWLQCYGPDVLGLSELSPSSSSCIYVLKATLQCIL